MELIVGALALGTFVCGAGWFLAVRSQSTLRGQIAGAADELRQAQNSHAADREELAGVRAELESLRLQEPALRTAMQAVSGEVLAHTTKQLREQFAEQRQHDQELAKRELDARTTRIEELVNPVKEKLKEFDDKVQAAEKGRSKLDGEFKERLEALGLSVETLGTRTTNLVDALKKPNVRGAWGELQLRSVIERAGMNSYCDFTEQATTVTGDGVRQRPDVLVRLPGDKLIVIDAKVPLDAFLAAQEAETTEVAEVAMARHARQVREHIKTLATKRYQDQFDNAADLVVMFLPNEGIYHGALDADRDLFDYAVDQNVLIATPTTLIALLRAVNYGWTQERLAKSAREIAVAGTELHSRIVNFANGFAKVGKNLETTVKTYNSAVATLDGRVLPQIAKLEGLDAKSARELLEIAPAGEVVRETRWVGLAASQEEI